MITELSIGLLIGCGVGFIVLELALRWGLGLGTPVLYVADPDMGYRLRPNQRLRRLGRRIEINAYSLRNAAIAPQCPPQTQRILLLGDSVANGNWWTDQSQILSELMRRQLESLEFGRTVAVLNASANSWGPRNELAYVQRFGTFGAQWVVLLLNTDDLFATTPTSLQVGRDRNYPDHNPPLALLELYQYYLRKSQPIPGLAAIQNEGGDRVGVNLGAIAKIHDCCQTQQAQLLVALSPLKRETKPELPRTYEQDARQRLLGLMAARSLPYLDLLPHFNAVDDTAALYRDHIHLSPQGNALVSQLLCKQLRESGTSNQP